MAPIQNLHQRRSETARLRRIKKTRATPSEVLCRTPQYVIDQDKLPFNAAILGEENEKLIVVVTKRLAAPQRVRVSLDDL